MTYSKPILEFKTRSKPEDAVLSLCGTGPNGAVQVAPLHEIGSDFIDRLSRINIISGSTFSYFVWLALREEKLKFQYFANFDAVNRTLHGASFTKGLGHFARWRPWKSQLYPNDFLIRTMQHLIKDSFLYTPLKNLSSNLVFWSYCQRRKSLVEISSQRDEFKEMNVIDLVRASISLNILHGCYEYGDYQFVDPNYSPAAKELRRILYRTDKNHLLLNHIKECYSRNHILAKHRHDKYPNVVMLRDLITFCLNLKNRDIQQTHESILRLPIERKQWQAERI